MNTHLTRMQAILAAIKDNNVKLDQLQANINGYTVIEDELECYTAAEMSAVPTRSFDPYDLDFT